MDNVPATQYPMNSTMMDPFPSQHNFLHPLHYNKSVYYWLGGWDKYLPAVVQELNHCSFIGLGTCEISVFVCFGGSCGWNVWMRTKGLPGQLWALSKFLPLAYQTWSLYFEHYESHATELIDTDIRTAEHQAILHQLVMLKAMKFKSNLKILIPLITKCERIWRRLYLSKGRENTVGK